MSRPDQLLQYIYFLDRWERDFLIGRGIYNHHHLAASADIELTTPFQYSLLVIAVRRSSLGMAVSLIIMSGKVSFRDRLCDDGFLQRTKDS